MFFWGTGHYGTAKPSPNWYCKWNGLAWRFLALPLESWLWPWTRFLTFQPDFHYLENEPRWKGDELQSQKCLQFLTHIPFLKFKVSVWLGIDQVKTPVLEWPVRAFPITRPPMNTARARGHQVHSRNPRLQTSESDTGLQVPEPLSADSSTLDKSSSLALKWDKLHTSQGCLGKPINMQTPSSPGHHSHSTDLFSMCQSKLEA